MRPITIKLLFCFVFAILFSTLLPAQQFYWVRGGGSNASIPFSGNSCEATRYMCTDPNGNIYALSTINNATAYADTFSAPTYGSYYNLLITSYNCSGQMRWGKMISSSGGNCIAYGIKADNHGHIYIAGQMFNGTLHIGNDTTIPGLLNQDQALLQLDTTGHFKWIRYVGNNTSATILNDLGYGSVALDSSDNPHLFNNARYGVPLSPTLTSHTGNADLTYDRMGNLLSIKPYQIDSTLIVVNVIIDRQSNKAFARGYRGDTWSGGGGGGDSSAYNFIAEFDTDRNLRWVDTIGTGYDQEGTVAGVVADGYGHLYLSGGGYDYMFYQGHAINHPPDDTGPYIAYIMKTDTAGNMEWIRQCNGHYNVGYNSITLDRNNRVAATGGFIIAANIGTDTVFTSAQSSMFTVLDTSGAFIAMQRIHGDGPNTGALCITSDEIGRPWRHGFRYYTGYTYPFLSYRRRCY